MGRKMQKSKDPVESKKELRRQQEAEVKAEKTGMTQAICKVCGPLSIDRFYILHVKGRWVPRPYCKSCERAILPSMGKTKRAQYAETNKVKMRNRYRDNREELAKKCREGQQESRRSLSDSYVKRLIRRETGLENKYITEEMIDQKRKDIQKRRERIEKGKTNGYHNKKWRKNWLSNEINGLGNSYIKRLIRRGGYKGIITEKMMKERRIEVMKDRNKRGKCGTAAQQLSDNYVARLIAKQKNVHVTKVSQREIEEGKERILEKRKKRGVQLKPKKKQVKKKKNPSFISNTSQKTI